VGVWFNETFYSSCVINLRTSADRLRRLVSSDCKLFESAKVLQLFVVMTCKYPINPIINPNLCL
jgi:hypothetical protein